MSVHQLSAQNFQVVGRQQKTLNINLPGRILVFFKMAGCPGCAAFEPIFYQLAGEERRVNYALIDLTDSRSVVEMSRSTSTPIQTVPFIMLYVDGNPFAKYTGKKNTPALKSFIGKALASFPSTASSQGGFMPQQPPAANPGMYGSGGYHHPAMAPQRGQSGFSQQPGPQQSQQGKVYMPEIGKTPSLQGIVKGDGTSQYAYLNDLDEEDEEKLRLPGQVTPHNVPWESGYKRMGTVD